MSVVEKMESYIGAGSASDIRSPLPADQEPFSVLPIRASSDEFNRKCARPFDSLQPALTASARAEEQPVYISLVPLHGFPDSRADGNGGVVEHSLADVLMEQLSKAELADTCAWKAHPRVPLEKEEHWIFEELDEHFEDEQRDAMEEDFVARSRKLRLIDGAAVKKAA